jgi:type IV pilus assembly protein PilA
MSSFTRDQRGFALIELLIAMIIIGVLAGIAVPSFLSQREKGQDACAKSQVKTMQTAIETVYTEDESYANATIDRLHATEGAVITNGACGNGSLSAVGGFTGAACDTGVGAGAHNYCLTQTSGSGRTYLVARNNTGTITRTCAPVGAGCVNGLW